MAQAAFKTCEICVSSPGHNYCEQCDQLFCDGCKISHLRTKMSKNHTFLSGPNINPEGKQYCNEHDENFIYYCKECNTPICKICVIENHKKHDFSEIKTLTEKYKAEVEREINMKLNKLKTNIMAIDQGTNAYQCDVNAVILSIREDGILLKKLIDTKVEDLIRSVKEKQATKLQSLQSIGNEFKTAFDKADEQHKIYRDTTQITETSKLLLKLKQIKLQIADVEVKQVPNMPSVNYVKNRAPAGEIKKLLGDLTFGETVKREETPKQQENVRYVDAPGEKMKICPVCSSTFSADVTDTSFEEHVIGHVGRICPLCYNTMDNFTDEEFQRHVNQHLEQKNCNAPRRPIEFD
ncbi:tripartite motif-containing protein 29-like [Mytilus californianus]|uniref:tripartite motif-containing protein 29-like n=1 Tax=Mytilus californianus TaxID=6549 RepID=UPI002248142C|nr:tripartite motif-containing protein 29-like [Mytilus californianus]